MTVECILRKLDATLAVGDRVSDDVWSCVTFTVD